MRTLEKRTNDLSFLKQALATYTTLACEDMRREGSVCKEVSLFMLTDSHRSDLPQTGRGSKMIFAAHTMDTVKIIQAVWTLLESLFDPDYEFKKIGITLSQLQDYESHQLTLFNDNDDPKRVSLMKTIDRINKKYNQYAIRSAACGTQNGNFEAQRPMMTPSYCTKWSDILVIDSVLP